MAKRAKTRVVNVMCETPADYRRMRLMAIDSPKIAGAILENDLFLIQDETRFRYLKQACRAVEIPVAK